MTYTVLTAKDKLLMVRDQLKSVEFRTYGDEVSMLSETSVPEEDQDSALVSSLRTRVSNGKSKISTLQKMLDDLLLEISTEDNKRERDNDGSHA